MALNIEEASQFFVAWKHLQAGTSQESEYAQWRSFFGQWSEAQLTGSTQRIQAKFDCEIFQNFADTFATQHAEYRRRGTNVNIWRAAGIGSDELRNSQTLAWILDLFSDHGQGSAILQRLVGRLEGSSVTADDVRGSLYRTRVEARHHGEGDRDNSRVDIQIESPQFLILVEVKIWAGETNNQLERYSDIAQKRAGPRKWLVLYLTIDGRMPKDEKQRSKIACISWKTVADILISYAADNTDLGQAGQAFRQFAEHLILFQPARKRNSRLRAIT